MAVGERDWLHEVHPLGIDLDEGEDVSSLHRLAERVKPRHGIRIPFLGETFVYVFGCDEVFPRLPGEQKDTNDGSN